MAEEGEGGEGPQRVVLRQRRVHDPHKPDNTTIQQQKKKEIVSFFLYILKLKSCLFSCFFI